MYEMERYSFWNKPLNLRNINQKIHHYSSHVGNNILLNILSLYKFGLCLQFEMGNVCKRKYNVMKCQSINGVSSSSFGFQFHILVFFYFFYSSDTSADCMTTMHRRIVHNYPCLYGVNNILADSLAKYMMLGFYKKVFQDYIKINSKSNMA